MTSRRATVSLLALAALPAIAACYDLNKVNPGPRWIDDFSTYPTPTWEAFSPWTCSVHVIEPQDLGIVADAGTDGGKRDGGARDGGTRDGGADTADASAPAPPCPQGAGETNAQDPRDVTGLQIPFQLRDAHQGLYAESTARMGPVDFTGFKQLTFGARLDSAFPDSSPLPSGTELRVDLGCSRVSSYPATQVVSLFMIDTSTWTPFRLDLSMFQVLQASLSQGCLSEVDSIRFLVAPGNTNRTAIDGTLFLDNISLQN